MEDSDTEANKGPFSDLDEVLASIGHALVAKGRLEDAQAFAQSKVSFESTDWDNWNGGTDVWTLSVKVPYPTYTSYSEDEKRDLVEFLDMVVLPFVPEIGYRVKVRLLPKPFKDPDWRCNVLGAVSGEITNQGRAHSKNVAPLEFEGLLFRSVPEQLLLYRNRNSPMREDVP
jgi:hypothetical protein